MDRKLVPVMRRSPWWTTFFILLFLLIPAGCVSLAGNSPSNTARQPKTISAAPATLAPTLLETLRQYEGQIAFKTNRNGETELYVMDPNGENQRPLPEPAVYREVVQLEGFSPTRDHLAETRQLGGNFYIVNRDLVTQVENQISFGGADYAPAWSPVEDWIVYTYQRGEGSVIYQVRSDGTESRPLTEFDGAEYKHPSWSPDGQRIVFWSNRSGRRQLWVMDKDGSNLRNISNSNADDWDPVWIKAPRPITGTSTPTPTPGGTADLEIGVIVADCMLDLTVVDRSGTVPIKEVQVFLDGEPFAGQSNIDHTFFTTSLQIPRSPQEQVIEILAWNEGYYAREPLRRTVATLCSRETVVANEGPDVLPTILVTATPTPENEVTAVVLNLEATAKAKVYGTPTPFPTNVVIATPTPVVVVITNTPTPKNEATATFVAALVTARAITTGTATPLPPWIVTATNTPTLTPTSTATPTPLPTPTPEVLPWTPPPPVAPTPEQPIPEIFVGKILFKSNRDGGEAIFVMDPDGSNIGKLTAPWPYQRAKSLEVFDEKRQFMTFVRESANGTQIFVRDFQFNTDLEVTRFGSGTSWDPAITRDGWRIAFVSNEPGNDEIFVVNRDGSGLQRLTFNDWEWDRHPSWSPDGSEIVFWSNREGRRRQLYIMSADGTNVRRISDGYADDWDPVWVKSR